MGRKVERLLCPFGKLEPHLTQRRLGRGLPPYQVASRSIQPFGQNRHGPKIGWGCAVFAGGAESPSNKVAWAKAYLHTKWHLNPSSRLASMDMGRKLGAVPFRRGRAGSPCNTMSPLLGHTYVPSFADAYSRLATIDMRRKLGAVPLWKGGAESPSNTMWPGPRPTCTPSFIFIHPMFGHNIVHYTNVTDRTGRQTDRQDNRLIA